MTTILWDEAQGHGTPRLPKKAPRPMYERALSAVSDMTGIKTEYLIGARGTYRKRAIARPRQMIMTLLREHDPHLYTYSRIGDILGGRDHSSVIHGIRKIAEMEEKDEIVAFMMEDLRCALGIEKGGA